MDKQMIKSDFDTENDNSVYVKKDYSSFVEKIEKANVDVGQQKVMLTHSNIQQVSEQLTCQRKIRSLDVNIYRGNLTSSKDNSTTGGNHGNNPLNLFPEEVWVMIFSQIPDVNDLHNISRTCVVFDKILYSTKQQWLFEKVIPFLFNHLHLKDVLSSRSCCKQWCHSIDRFFEEQSVMNTKVSQTFHFEYCYSIPFPLPDDLEFISSDSEDSSSAVSDTFSHHTIKLNHDDVREAMRLHKRNPFIGRFVKLEESTIEDYPGIQNVDNQHNFVLQSELLLMDIGRHISNLSLNCTSGLQSPEDFYQVIKTSLGSCVNLKRICISGDLNWGRGNLNRLRVESLENFDEHQTLENIMIGMDDRRVFWIQDKLIAKFSSQLKRLEVTMWNNVLYAGFDWGNLVELKINSGIENLLLLQLKKTNMMNLRKLTLTLRGNGSYLKGLVDLSKWFLKLNYLELILERFREEHGILDEKLNEGEVGSKELTTVEVTACLTEMLNYDWLLKFPNVRKLIIRHGHWTNYNKVGGYIERVGGRQYSERYRNDNMLRIARYLGEEIGVHAVIENIYCKSRLWVFLPFLKELIIYNANYEPVKKMVFTRQGYEHFKVNNNGNVSYDE